MINTETTYSNILNKKYNVLKKNLIIIDADETRIKEFEDTIRKLDSIKQQEYERKMKEKDYLTTTLEDEYKRLYELIGLIEIRKRERDSYLDDYYNIVRENLIGLDDIKEMDEIDTYNNRLETISDYLLNDEKYLKYKNEKESLLDKKKEEEELKKSEEVNISDLENKLLLNLKELITNSPLYDNLNFDELDENISKYSIDSDSKEKELNTYLNSYNVLLNNGISDNEKNEYSIFIDALKKDYLELLEKKYILIIYKLIIDNKEQDVIDIIEERINKIKGYDLENDNRFDDIFSMIKKYQEKVDNFEEIKMTINSINNNLDRVNEKLKEILEELNKPEIVLLLKEFCIEKDYITNNISIEEDETMNVEKEESGLFGLLNDYDTMEENKNDVAKGEISFSDELFFASPTENNQFVPEEKKETKFNAVMEIKDSNTLLDLEKNRKNALDVMKKVCSSISTNNDLQVIEQNSASI